MTKVTYYVNSDSAPGGDGTTFATTGATRAFASSAEAEAGLQRTINVGDEVEVLCGGTAADTAQLTIDGWTVNGRLTWRAIDSHGGKWNTGIYRLEWTTTGASQDTILIAESNVTFDGLQIQDITGTDIPRTSVSFFSSATAIVFKNSFLRSAGRGVAMETPSSLLYNNIIVAGSYNINLYNAGTGRKIYNNTLVRPSMGYSIVHNFSNLIGANSISLQNNLIISSSSPIYSYYATGFTADTGYNVCTGANGTGTTLTPGTNNKFSQTITFADPENYDYRTLDTDCSVNNNLYADPVAPITTDIANHARPSVGAVFAGAYEPLNNNQRFSAGYSKGYFRGYK